MKVDVKKWIKNTKGTFVIVCEKCFNVWVATDVIDECKECKKEK